MKKSKWSNLEVSKQEFRKIYEKNRVKAYIILKNNHKKEYSSILEDLMFKEYLRRIKCNSKN